MNPPDITGHTKLFAILADPIHHVRAPQGINALLRERGVDGVMVPMHVPAADLRTVVAGLRKMPNFGGFIATVPHKTDIVALCDTVSPMVVATGAANAVRREADGTLSADMFDGQGFVVGLRQAGIDLTGRSVYLAGAGGAANAIAFALANEGIARLTVANRTRSRADELLARLSVHKPGLRVEAGTRDPSGHDIVVNATSLGLRPSDALPLDCNRLMSAMTVAEIIMQPRETPLLKAAAAAGCRVQYGQPMLDCQLALMADFLGMTR